MKFKFLTLLLLLPAYGYCCTCSPDRSIVEDFNSVTKIVIGTIIAQETITTIDSSAYNSMLAADVSAFEARRFTSDSFNQFTLVLSEASYKGSFQHDTVIIRTAQLGGECGYSFQVGKKYVVYGYDLAQAKSNSNPRHEYFWTDTCTRTRLYHKKEQKKLMRIVRNRKKKGQE